MATGIGTRIKRARERRRWTQRQLAAELGVNIKTVDNWENGRTSPKNSIGALEQVLGVRLDEEPEPEPEIPPGLRAAIRDTLPEEDQERVTEAVRRALAPPAGRAAARPAGPGRRQAG